MPLPKTKDPGKVIEALYEENANRPPGRQRPRDQIIAIAMNVTGKSKRKKKTQS